MPADTGRVAVYQYWTGKMPMCKTVDHCYEGGSKTVVDLYHSGNNLGTGPVLFQYYNVYWDACMYTQLNNAASSLVDNTPSRAEKNFHQTSTYQGKYHLIYQFCRHTKHQLFVMKTPGMKIISCLCSILHPSLHVYVL